MGFRAGVCGVLQADVYIGLLGAAFQNIADQPGIGRVRAEIRQDLLSILVKEHVVFFKITRSGIAVVRVLHQSMD